MERGTALSTPTVNSLWESLVTRWWCWVLDRWRSGSCSWCSHGRGPGHWWWSSQTQFCQHPASQEPGTQANSAADNGVSDTNDEIGGGCILLGYWLLLEVVLIGLLGMLVLDDDKATTCWWWWWGVRLSVPWEWWWVVLITWNTISAGPNSPACTDRWIFLLLASSIRAMSSPLRKERGGGPFVFALT